METKDPQSPWMWAFLGFLVICSIAVERVAGEDSGLGWLTFIVGSLVASKAFGSVSRDEDEEARAKRATEERAKGAAEETAKYADRWREKQRYEAHAASASKREQDSRRGSIRYRCSKCGEPTAFRLPNGTIRCDRRECGHVVTLP